MKKVCIVTGGNRGLGEALIDWVLNDEDAIIISLSRSISNRHYGIPNDKFLFIKVDLEESFSGKELELIEKYIDKNSTLYFFNNAGVILPIEKIGDLVEQGISSSMKVNIEYPVNLINWILKKYINTKLVIVNITSGAAKNPVAFWSLYGAAKAFMQMFLLVLKEENKANDNLIIYNIDPGTMNTSMQERIREKDFPRQDFFKELKNNNSLISPENAAIKILKEIQFDL